MVLLSIFLAATPTAPNMSYPSVRVAVITAIGLGVCLVLAMCARRQWARGPIGSGGQLVHVGDVVLERRSALRLVGISTQRVMLAPDPTGLKSIRLLNNSFNCVIKPTMQANVENPELPDDLRGHTL
jgi:hypothetical protein